MHSNGKMILLVSSYHTISNIIFLTAIVKAFVFHEEKFLKSAAFDGKSSNTVTLLSTSPHDSIQLSSNNIQLPMVEQMNCQYHQKQIYLNERGRAFTITDLCILLKIARNFTDFQDVAILSTWTNLLQLINTTCNYVSHNTLRLWKLQQEGFESKDIFPEIHNNRNKNVRKFIIACSPTCTSLVLNYFYSIQSVFSDLNPVFFIGYTELLYISTDLPQLIISIDHRSYDVTRYCQTYSVSTKETSSVTSNSTLAVYARSNQVWEPASFIPTNYTDDERTDIRFLPIPSYYPLNNHEVMQKSVYRVVTVLEEPYTMLHPNSEELFNSEEVLCDIGKVCWKYETFNSSCEYGISTTNRSGCVKFKKAYCCIGFLMDLLDMLEKSLSFDSKIYLVQDGKYGETVDGVWVGMVGDLVHDRADIAMASLTINTKRSSVIDYSHPFLIGGMSLITRLREQTIPFVNDMPFQSLTLTLWTLTFLVSFFAAACLTLMEQLTHTRPYKFIESVSYVAGLLFQRDIGGKNPHHWSAKTVAISTALFTMIIISTYAAVMTANSVTRNLKLPVKGFKDEKIRNPTPEFKFGTVAHSSYTHMFRESKDPVWNRMNLFMKQYNFINTDEVFQKLRTGELDAIIHDYYIAYHHIAKDPECRFQFAGPPIKDGGSGIAVQKGSPLRPLLSELIIEYQGKEFLQEIASRWMINTCVNKNDDDNTALLQQVGIRYFGGLFIILLAALCVSILFLIFEFAVFRCVYNTGNTYQVKLNLD